MQLLDFWKSNPEYWIAIDNKSDADKTITELFYNKYEEINNWIEQVIYLDQFSRHFQRYLKHIKEDTIIASRNEACKIVINNLENVKNLDEIEIIFVLMPFKHTRQYKYIFDILFSIWLPKDYNFVDYKYLSKFFYDTYKKAYTFENIKSKICNEHNNEYYNPYTICEFYSTNYLYNLNNKTISSFPQLPKFENPIVSLSGGVDSMVLLYYYKITGLNPSAIHIIYGNRSQSIDEYRFIVEYCNNLQITLYTYRIEWLQRDKVDRDWYEQITREIRFMVYQAVGNYEANIILGHIKDDIIENIWTNFATSKHLNNLKKMKISEIQNGVYICRPLLDITKKEVLKLAHSIGIPYLLNTTPEWSNRGKYRNNFYKAVINQYGENTDNAIIQSAEMISSQFRLLNDLLYKPIIQSYYVIRKETEKDGRDLNNIYYFDISLALKHKIELSQWEQLLEQIFHQIIKYNKPSINSIRNFYNRINKKEDKKCIQLKKNIRAYVFNKKDKIYLEIEIK